MDDEMIKKSACYKLLDMLRRAQLAKVMVSFDGNMGPGVVFSSGLSGVCRCMNLKSLDSWKFYKMETDRFHVTNGEKNGHNRRIWVFI